MARPRRILIVDDEAPVRRLVATLLIDGGYQVSTAANAAEAMAVCQAEEPFDVLLSDVQMPGLNGHQLAQWFIGQQPQARTVLMSGFDDFDCPGCAAQTQCIRLAKPFAGRELLSAMSQVFTDTCGGTLYSIS